MTRPTTSDSASVGAMTGLIHDLSGKTVREPTAESWAIAPPIFQTSTFGYATTEAAAESCAATHPTDCYTRYGNPNNRVVEKAIERLEGAEASVLTGSGMGATSLVFLTLLGQGDHVVAQQTHYAATSQALRHWLPRLGIEVTQVEQEDLGAFEQAIRPNTRLIYAESPANPLIKLTDLAGLGALGRKHGITTCVDSTLATPVNQRPLDLGIDLVMHSATKYLGGHSDVTGGIIAGDRERVDRLWESLIVFGMVLHPFEAWLLARGLQTLPMRMRIHNENTLRLAKALEEHPRVKQVYYPGLPSHPQHELGCSQMSGFGGLLSFDIDGGYDEAKAFVGRMKLAQKAVSLGGTKTLVVHTASMIYPHVNAETRRTVGVTDTLIRVAVGIEDGEDIVGDFVQALG